MLILLQILFHASYDKGGTNVNFQSQLWFRYGAYTLKSKLPTHNEATGSEDIFAFKNLYWENYGKSTLFTIIYYLLVIAGNIYFIVVHK